VLFGDSWFWQTGEGEVEVPMRAFCMMLLAVAGLLTFSAIGQEPAAQGSKQKVQFVHTEDGGVTEVLQSIVVPPKAGVPFTLTLETEWMKQLYDGGTTTFVNKRRIARDAAGRVYQERWALVPKNDDRVQSMLTVIQIADPTAQTLYNCFLVDSKANTCELLNYEGSTSKIYRPKSPATGPLPGDQGSAVHGSLGKRFIAGVETEGTHDTLTYNPGVFGNDRKVTIENEFWWSPQLGLNLLSIRTDPRIGTQTFTVTSLVQGDPDPSLFELPAGFKVVDHRQTTPPSSTP
jgi:hypothetical protein